jgi:hypothetical protein
MIGHQVYLNTISYLSKYGQFGCAFFHQEMVVGAGAVVGVAAVVMVVLKMFYLSFCK